MKKIISAVLALCLVGGTFSAIESFAPETVSIVYAAEDTVIDGDLTFAFDLEKTKAYVLKCDTNAEGEIVVPSEIDGVPVVGLSSNGAFKDCKLVTSIKLPITITYLGRTPFQNCILLNEVNLPEGITELPAYAFNGCKSLNKVTLPEGIKTIGESAFYNCSKLSSIDIPDSVTKINSDYYGTFSGTALESITLPKGLKIITTKMFANCTKLSSVTIPDSVKIIESDAFAYCSSLKSIVIPDSVVSIAGNPFHGCPLESVNVPEDFKNIVTTTTTTTYYNTTYYRIQTTSARPTTGKPTPTTIAQTTANIFTDSNRIKELEEKVSALESEMAALKQKIEQLNNTLNSNFFGNMVSDVKGDTNCDKTVDMSDAVLIMQSLSNPSKYKLTEQGRKNADFDGDGVTNGDALTIQKKLLKLD